MNCGRENQNDTARLLAAILYTRIRLFFNAVNLYRVTPLIPLGVLPRLSMVPCLQSVGSTAIQPDGVWLDITDGSKESVVSFS